MLNTISTRDLQRHPRQAINRVKDTQIPHIIIADNQPAAVLVPLDMYEKIKMQEVIDEGMKEYTEGKAQKIDNLNDEFEEINQIVNS